MSEVTVKRRVGRPADTVFGTIGVDIPVTSLTWSDGEWYGPPYMEIIQALIAAGTLLEVPGTFGHTVPASGDEPIAVMAIMARIAAYANAGLLDLILTPDPNVSDLPIQATGFRGDVPIQAIIALAKLSKQSEPATAVA